MKNIKLFTLIIIMTISVSGIIGQNVHASEVTSEEENELTTFDDGEIEVVEEEQNSEQGNIDEEGIDNNEVEFEDDSEFVDSEDEFSEQSFDISENQEVELSETTEKCGECGAGTNKIYWTISEDNTLKIEGQGEMQDWNAETDVPWNQFRSEIEQIEIDRGITSIGAYAFYDCVNAAEVKISDSVKKVGLCAFFNCNGLSTLTIG